MMEIAIDIHDVHKRYKQTHAVRGVSFTIERGEIFGILGPNGAGKTTTLEIMEGIRKQSSGTVRVLGLNPQRQGMALRQRSGNPFPPTSMQERLKVGEALRFYESFYTRRGNSEQLVNLLGLQEKLNTAFKDLSGGWKQRVTLALATIHQPELLFLDEPTTGLDPQARRDIWSLIEKLRSEGMTIVLTTHYMEEAERLCDRIAMFQNGVIAALDTPRRLVTNFGQVRRLALCSSDADAERISQLPGVSRVSQEAGWLHVYTPELQVTAQHIFTLAGEMGWTITDFRYEMGTLEDLFVNLTEEGKLA